jgi:hypothetical protein
VIVVITYPDQVKHHGCLCRKITYDQLIAALEVEADLEAQVALKASTVSLDEVEDDL